MKKGTRLQQAENKYCEQLHEWLTNPKNEDLPNEIVEPQIEAAFHTFLDALLLDEDECAQFITEGNFLNELELLPLIFDHFGSTKIYDAIYANCEAAFSHKYSFESAEMETKRRMMLERMAKALEI